MALDKTSKIDEELRRCMAELNQSRMLGSSGLQALEAELFGGLKGRKDGYVGVMMDGEEGDAEFKHGYRVERDTELNLDELNNVHSCLSGGLYSGIDISDTKIYKETKKIVHDGQTYDVVAHWTTNRKDSEKVCSISLFDQDNTFLAYVFTTNDPLAFDNFNCYRGEAGVTEKPRLSCVEQLVFCNNKVQMAQAYLDSLSGKDLEDALRPTARNFRFWVNILDDVSLKVEIRNLDSRAPQKGSANYAKLMQTIKDQQLECLLKHYDHFKYEFYEQKYRDFLKSTTTFSRDLVPGDSYKSTGRNVILSQDQLAIWDSISMPCVIGARLKQLRNSAHERKLTAAMIPKCVIECSEFDDIWAWKRPDGVSMEDLINSEFGQLVQKVKTTTVYQENFIRRINAAGSHVDIADILFDAKNKEKLGLSERFIQALWTGEITLQVKDLDLEVEIQRRLEPYSIPFKLYNPKLCKSTHKCRAVAGAIGVSKRATGVSKQD